VQDHISAFPQILDPFNRTFYNKETLDPVVGHSLQSFGTGPLPDQFIRRHREDINLLQRLRTDQERLWDKSVIRAFRYGSQDHWAECRIRFQRTTPILLGTQGNSGTYLKVKLESLKTSCSRKIKKALNNRIVS